MASEDHSNESPKPSGKKAKPLSQKEQSQRFVETAKALQTDESGASFSKAIDVLFPMPATKDNGGT